MAPTFRFIQAMLGHESLDTTQIYTQVGIAKLAAVHAATHPGAMLKRAEQEAQIQAFFDGEVEE